MICSVQRIGNAKFKLLKTYFDDSDKDKFIFCSESIIKPFPGNSFRDNAEGLLDIIDVKFVVSFRNPVDLVISRFIHDKNVIQHERRIAEVIHFSGGVLLSDFAELRFSQDYFRVNVKVESTKRYLQISTR